MKRKKNRRKKELSGSNADEALSGALKLHQGGRIDEAESAYERLIQTYPECAEAHYLLGLIIFSRGEPEGAVALMRKALALQPRFPEALNDLGNVLHDAGRLDEAAAVFNKLQEIEPAHKDVYNNLGVVLKSQGKYEKAMEAFQRAIEQQPRDAGRHYNLANTYKKLGRLEEAISAFRKVLDVDPGFTDAYHGLAALLRENGRLSEVNEVFRQWFRHNPENPVARHLSLAGSDQHPPSRASDEYVRQVFDRFADTFDEDLQALCYQVPMLLIAALRQQKYRPKNEMEVLDAGCGTGVCSEVLRPFAGRLVGVDLSPAMIDKARQLNRYDELIVAELTGYLGAHPNTFDLMVFADTVNYFGDLEPLLSAAAGALHVGGCLFLTCEEDMYDQTPAGYRLGHHGRYCHTVTYLSRCLSESGLTVRDMTTAELRQEAHSPVAGLVAWACKVP